MKEKVMSIMQAFSKAMFMPVLILPIAGLLIAVGNVFTNARLIEILPFLDGSSAIIRIIHPSHTLVLLLKVLCCISHT